MKRHVKYVYLPVLGLFSISLLIASPKHVLPGEEEMNLSPPSSLQTLNHIPLAERNISEDLITDASIPEVVLGLMPSESATRHFIEEEGLDFSLKGEERGKAQKQSRIGLSIDGGGIRGLMPAIWLKQLEEVLDENGEIGYKKGSNSLYQVFDAVGGTSIGGILSLGTAAGIAPEAFVGLLENEGQNVFWRGGERRVLRAVDFFGLTIHEYPAHPLEGLLKNHFGEQLLSDAKTDVLITACTNKSEPWIFKNETEIPYKMWEVARSTSAAPTYFSAYKPKDEVTVNHSLDHPHLVDGGLWINNPTTLVTAHIVQGYQGGVLKPKELHMLSLGTGECPVSTIPVSAGKASAGAIIETLMSSHSRGNHLLMRQLLWRNYHRINPELLDRIKLDNTKPRTIEILREYAEQEEHRNVMKKFVKKTRKIIRKKLEQADA
jgi:predicted acylesterase/phospholipase RssA